MTPAEDTTLIELLTSKSATKKEVSQIQIELEKAPYSQPLQRLAEQHGLDNQNPIYKYSVQNNNNSDRDEEVRDEVMTLAHVDIKTRKPNKKSKSKTKVHKKPKNASLDTKSKRPKTDAEVQKPKATKLKQESYSAHHDDDTKISDYTAWINSLKNTLSHHEKTSMVEAEGSKKKEKKAKNTNKISTKKSKKEKKARKKKKKKSSIKNSQLLSKIKKSIKGKKNPASESLAELYLAQGHPKKAIKTYEKLSLINPEKSDYFAARIDELKKKFK